MTPVELRAVSLTRALAARGELQRARKERHLTLRDVAHGIGANPSTVHRWETGESVPTSALALRWARLMDLIEKPELVA
ncbi:helix-turn-helix transcriptional regulator [Streptomyces tendae]|uniref:helix-turn-helix transcriptional regulator n=1 Tax=Streptomyces tendae TaxID=1932 RepID=UPI0036FDC3A7